MRSIGKFFVSLSKFVINLAIIYLITRIIEYTAQLLNFYIPFEFTFILLFIFYLLILKILKLKSFSSLIFERFDKYKVHITSTVIIFLLILIGNEVVKAKKVFDVVSYYSNYSHSKPDYTNRDSSKLVEVSTIDSTDEQVYINCLSKNEQPPLDYVLNKINQHQLLIFGEMHDISDNLIFLNKIIPDLYNAGVRVIAMEVCQSYDDGVLEKLINGKEYDRNLALEIARHQPWLMWGAKDYWDVLESVWKLNNSLKPNQEKMEIIGLESDYDMPSMVMVLSKKDKKPSPFYEKFRIFRVLKSMPNGDNRDELMAKEIEEKIIKKNKKGIVWVGADHSFPNYKWNPKGRGRMGYILNKKFGDKIFQIYLHNNFIQN